MSAEWGWGSPNRTPLVRGVGLPRHRPPMRIIVPSAFSRIIVGFWRIIVGSIQQGA
jgi:hypothetical protein